MTNKIIIDGWNLAWVIPEVRAFIPADLQRARNLLNSKIKSYFSQKKTIYKVIYDGQPGIAERDGYIRGIDIRFSKKPETADNLVLTFLKKQKRPGQWTVVSSDRALRSAARSIGAVVVGSQLFAEKLSSQTQDDASGFKQNPSLSSRELDFWLNQFGKEK